MRNQSLRSCPVAPRTLARTTGRMTPSSHSSHSPTMRIDARPSLWPDVLHERPIVLGMSGLGHRPCLLRGVGDERLLSCDGHVPPKGTWPEIRPVLLQPIAVALG